MGLSVAGIVIATLLLPTPPAMSRTIFTRVSAGMLYAMHIIGYIVSSYLHKEHEWWDLN